MSDQRNVSIDIRLPANMRVLAQGQATVTIDLDAIQHNFNHARATAPSSRIMAIVKGDAYGHGAIEVAKALAEADAFAVAAVGEALSLRRAGIEQKILVMGGFVSTDELDACIEHRIDPVLHHDFHLECLQAVRPWDACPQRALPDAPKVWATKPCGSSCAIGRDCARC